MCEDCRPDLVFKDPRDVDVGFSKSRFPGANDVLPASPQGQGDTARRSASRSLHASPSRYASPEAEPFQGTWTAAARAARARENLSYSYPAPDEQQSRGKHWNTVMAPPESTQTATRDQRADVPSSSATAGYAYPPPRSQTDPYSRTPQPPPQSGSTGPVACAHPPLRRPTNPYGQAPQQPPQAGPAGAWGRYELPGPGQGWSTATRKERSAWTPEDDDSLLRMYGEHYDWEEISLRFPGRSIAACKARIKNVHPWSGNEDNKLLRLRDEERLQWPQIEEQLTGRTAYACQLRYKKLQGQRP